MLNGTRVDGQAADAAGALGSIGFNIVAVETYETSDITRTTVLYGTFGITAARRVAAHITGGAALVEVDDLEGLEVTVVVGSDFTTVHDQPSPEGSADDKLTTTSTMPEQSTTTAAGQTTTTTVPPTTTSTVIGYSTGEPPKGTECG